MHNDNELLPFGVMEILATLRGTPAKIPWENIIQYDKRDSSLYFNLSVLQSMHSDSAKITATKVVP